MSHGGADARQESEGTREQAWTVGQCLQSGILLDEGGVPLQLTRPQVLRGAAPNARRGPPTQEAMGTPGPQLFPAAPLELPDVVNIWGSTLEAKLGLPEAPPAARWVTASVSCHS